MASHYLAVVLDPAFEGAVLGSVASFSYHCQPPLVAVGDAGLFAAAVGVDSADPVCDGHCIASAAADHCIALVAADHCIAPVAAGHRIAPEDAGPVG